MIIYAPDIAHEGDHKVTFYETVNSEEIPLIEFHTNNPIYAQIYYDTIGAIINGTPKGTIMSTKSLGWKRQGLKHVPLVIPYKPRLENPWDDIEGKVWKQCPLKYKADLVKWAVSKMKWKLTKTKYKTVGELKKIWCYKNQGSPAWKGRIK